MKMQKKWRKRLDQIIEDLETLQSELQDYGDARSDKWQESEQGEAFRENLSQLEEGLETLNQIE